MLDFVAVQGTGAAGQELGLDDRHDGGHAGVGALLPVALPLPLLHERGHHRVGVDQQHAREALGLSLVHLQRDLPAHGMAADDRALDPEVVQQGQHILRIDLDGAVLVRRQALAEAAQVGGDYREVLAEPGELALGSARNLGLYAASWIAGWPNRPSSTAALT